MNPIGLYLHIPFCDGKCHYCSFYSRRATDAELQEYTDKLIHSIRTWGDKLHREVDTIYFGGGTPSLLGHHRLTDILSAIYQSFTVADNAEITVEVNPTSACILDLSAMRKAGFNRLSIGMQSSDNDELQTLGRRHTAEDAQHIVMEAKKAGFENISLDVMLAIPGQTIASLDRTLRFCANSGVTHISSYILKVEEGTKFYRIKNELALFSDDVQAQFYEYAVNKLRDLEYEQYEISNFSKPGYEGRHNLHYWHDEEYLGLGPSAHSYLNGERFYYDNSIDAFYHDQAVYESEGGSRDEYIMLALRLTEGMRFKEYEKRYHDPVSEKFLSGAKQLQDHGLAVLSGDSLRLTVKGFLVSNTVIAYLLENT